MKTKTKTLTSNEYQTDFIEQQVIDDNKAPLSSSELLAEGKEHHKKIIKQKALSVVDPLTSVKMLELLKKYSIDRIEGDRPLTGTMRIKGTIEGIKLCMGYYDMTEEQQEKIDNYINS